MNKTETTKTLKTLIVLTSIGCLFGYWSDIKDLIYGSDEKNIQGIRDAQNSGIGFIKKLYTDDFLNLSISMNANMIPISIIGIIATSLCLIGVFKMKNNNKDGFYYYIVGQFLPLIGTIIFTGFIIFKTFIIYTYIFPILFIFLYYIQYKKMKNNELVNTKLL
jgi:hypothetical protein